VKKISKARKRLSFLLVSEVCTNNYIFSDNVRTRPSLGSHF